MSKVFITGSTDGLGLLATEQMISDGHQVYLHARNENRANEAVEKIKGAAGILTGDLASTEEVKQMAKELNEMGTFDAVIHNAGVLSSPAQELFHVNVLAPYILTAVMHRPERLVYLSSSMHKGGRMLNLESEIDRITYSDSKLLITTLMKAVSERFRNSFVNAVDPGWVPTKMGGMGAPDDLKKGAETQVWLATSNELTAKVSGNYFYHKQQKTPHNTVDNQAYQHQLIAFCQSISGIPLIV